MVLEWCVLMALQTLMMVPYLSKLIADTDNGYVCMATEITFTVYTCLLYTAPQKTDTEATLNLLAAQRYPDEIHVGKRLALNAVHMSCISRSQ